MNKTNKKTKSVNSLKGTESPCLLTIKIYIDLIQDITVCNGLVIFPFPSLSEILEYLKKTAEARLFDNFLTWGNLGLKKKAALCYKWTIINPCINPEIETTKQLTFGWLR